MGNSKKFKAGRLSRFSKISSSLVKAGAYLASSKIKEKIKNIDQHNMTAKIQASKEKIAQLGDQLKALSEQKVDQSTSGADISDEQIDELVREIEFCIAQLKQ